MTDKHSARTLSNYTTPEKDGKTVQLAIAATSQSWDFLDKIGKGKNYKMTTIPEDTSDVDSLIGYICSS